MAIEQNQEIRELAYRIWQEEGCPDGRAVDHWVKAQILWEENYRRLKPFFLTAIFSSGKSVPDFLRGSRNWDSRDTDPADSPPNRFEDAAQESAGSAHVVRKELAKKEGVNMKTVATVKPIGGTFAGCRFEAFSFGSIRIDGVTYEHDVLIDRGQVRKRKKKRSKKFREAFGHTPLSAEEKIPWKCRRLVIGTGTGGLPVMDDVKKEAKRRHVQLLMLPTAEAIEELRENPEETNAILHVTC